MAKMKIEVLALRAARFGIGRRERLVAALPALGRVASRAAFLANIPNRLPPLARLSQRALGFAAERPLPAWRSDPFRDDEASGAAGSKGTVLLLADTFNRYFEPENLRAAIRVLAASGYGVSVARQGGRPLCCGRTRLAAGQVQRARAEARRVLAATDGGLPVIGLEPSCLYTLCDEFPALLPGSATGDLASRAFLLDEFLAREQVFPPLRPVQAGVAHVHGHCHQKAFGTFPSTLAMLRKIPGLDVRSIDSSCCGMAGSFGYQAETQAVSRAMAEEALLPAVRSAAAGDLIVASGTSCRHQIRDLAGRMALHPVRVLEQALA